METSSWQLWMILLASFTALGAVALGFTRRTYRLVAVALLVASAVLLVRHGAGRDYAGSFLSAGDGVVRAMLAGVAGAHPTIGPLGGIALSILLLAALTAVEVRKPATMPGGSTLDSVASTVSATDIQRTKVAAALMTPVHRLEANPWTYEVRLHVEKCDATGRPRYGYIWSTGSTTGASCQAATRAGQPQGTATSWTRSAGQGRGGYGPAR